MNLKIKNHFNSLNPKKFVIGTVVLLIITDLVNSYYLREYWVHKDLSLLYVQKVALSQGLDFQQLSTDSVSEIKSVIDNGFFFFLLIVLLNNLFFYIFYLRRKLWAQGYILFYTITNVALSSLFIFEGPVLGFSWLFYNIATIPLYLYLYLGVKILKSETTEISPGHEKTAQ